MRATRSHRCSIRITVQIVKYFCSLFFSSLFPFSKNIFDIMQNTNWKRIESSSSYSGRDKVLSFFFYPSLNVNVRIYQGSSRVSGRSSLTVGFICQRRDKIDWSMIETTGRVYRWSETIFIHYRDCFMFSFNMVRINCPVDEFANGDEDIECKFLIPNKYLTKIWLGRVQLRVRSIFQHQKNKITFQQSINASNKSM